ncbi:MAG TPA: ATP-binding protein, partial [Longimicrobiaceae bacterium]|nr:ATP-binding protein [Longimicrobiaceae bacterium]
LYIFRDDGQIERLEIAHADPEKEKIAQALKRYPIDPDGSHPAFTVLRTGEPILLPEIPEAMVAAVAQDEEHLRILRDLGMRSAMVVPLKARGRTLGSMTVVAAESGRRYTQEDLAVAQEFARRAALAVDNARLFRESQEANRTKAEFLATVSHELRTPLNAVTGYASLLREGIPVPLPEESLDYVERIGHSARHLLHLIEDILTFSRLETGQEVIRVRPVGVQELLAEVRAVTEPLAQEKGLRFTIDAPDEPVQLRTDPRRLRQILHNLLDNAIKFTEKGQVELGARVEEDGVWFQVRDTGIGIAPQDRKKIFEPFKQLEQSNTRVAGGTGLGLSVTDKLVRLLGGSLKLESEPGQGSTFCVCLPAGGPRHASGSSAAPRERSVPHASGSDE